MFSGAAFAAGSVAATAGVVYVVVVSMLRMIFLLHFNLLQMLLVWV